MCYMMIICQPTFRLRAEIIETIKDRMLMNNSNTHACVGKCIWNSVLLVYTEYYLHTQLQLWENVKGKVMYIKLKRFDCNDYSTLNFYHFCG